MSQTAVKNQSSVKILPDDQQFTAPGGRIESVNAKVLPKNCLVIPMVILEHPEPIRQTPAASFAE